MVLILTQFNWFERNVLVTNKTSLFFPYHSVDRKLLAIMWHGRPSYRIKLYHWSKCFEQVHTANCDILASGHILILVSYTLISQNINSVISNIDYNYIPGNCWQDNGNTRPDSLVRSHRKAGVVNVGYDGKVSQAPAHGTQQVKSSRVLTRPPNSQDVNQIKHPWNAPDKQVRSVEAPPRNHSSQRNRCQCPGARHRSTALWVPAEPRPEGPELLKWAWSV